MERVPVTVFFYFIRPYFNSGGIDRSYCAAYLLLKICIGLHWWPHAREKQTRIETNRCPIIRILKLIRLNGTHWCWSDHQITWNIHSVTGIKNFIDKVINSSKCVCAFSKKKQRLLSSNLYWWRNERDTFAYFHHEIILRTCKIKQLSNFNEKQKENRKRSTGTKNKQS